jgi:hypothetical protein
MKPKAIPKPVEYTDEPPDQYLMLGSYGGIQMRIPRDRKIKPQIGFIRQEIKVSARKRK